MLIRMANSYLFTLIVPALMLISETPKTEAFTNQPEAIARAAAPAVGISSHTSGRQHERALLQPHLLISVPVA